MTSKKITRICEFCGKPFEVSVARSNKGQDKFCSTQCYHTSQQSRVTKICEQCGGNFEIPTCFDKEGRGRFCSRSCKGQAFRTLADRPCKRCGVSFRPKSATIQFCSNDCRYSALRTRILRNCETCTTPFETTPSRTIKGKGRFCSPECFQRSKHVKIALTCENCDTMFYVLPNKRTRKFCGLKCAARARRNSVIIDGKEFKFCGRCKTSLPVESFGLMPSGQRRSYCKPCSKEALADWHSKNGRHMRDYQREYISNRMESDWGAVRFNGLKSRSKQRGETLPFSQSDFREWYLDQEEECAYCRLTIAELRLMSIRVTVDRKDNKIGYTLENIALACFVCNRIKTNILTFDDMRIVGPVIRHRLLSIADHLSRSEIAADSVVLVKT